MNITDAFDSLIDEVEKNPNYISIRYLENLRDHGGFKQNSNQIKILIKWISRGNKLNNGDNMMLLSDPELTLLRQIQAGGGGKSSKDPGHYSNFYGQTYRNPKF